MIMMIMIWIKIHSLNQKVKPTQKINTLIKAEEFLQLFYYPGGIKMKSFFTSIS